MTDWFRLAAEITTPPDLRLLGPSFRSLSAEELERWEAREVLRRQLQDSLTVEMMRKGVAND